MANFTANISKGTASQLGKDGADIRLLLLSAADSQAILEDIDTVALALAEAGTTEATFANYARKTLTGVTTILDDTGNTQALDADDVVFTDATAGETIVQAMLYLHVTNDSDSVPIAYFDASFTTSGSTVTLQVNAAGLVRSSAPA